LICGNVEHARQVLDQALTHVRDVDRFAEKVALDYLGRSYSRQGESKQAALFFGQALALAREVGDRQHQANLLWHLAIQHAELGQRDQAMANARAALELFQSMGNPEGDVFERYLQQYLRDAVLTGPTSIESAGNTSFADPMFGGSVSTLMPVPVGSVPATGTAVPASRDEGANSVPSGPGLLRMAFSAVQSASKFTSSGFKTVTPQMLQGRLRACAACQHHTGLRCKICGCFTNVKARMLHEACPIGKWPEHKVLG
jgi:hypothetical protein